MGGPKDKRGDRLRRRRRAYAHTSFGGASETIKGGGSCIFINAFAVLTRHAIALVLFRYVVT
jgi:hypothetical protein